MGGTVQKNLHFSGTFGWEGLSIVIRNRTISRPGSRGLRRFGERTEGAVRDASDGAAAADRPDFWRW